MTPTRQGSYRLFRFKGIDVHVHWSWFVVAIYSVSSRVPNYQTPVWALLEYLMLFLVVLLHEFGHALACRSVGGSSDQIVLWPLGGVAYVSPPPRAGAQLWSIAAGPLVNVVLLPVFYGVFYACRGSGAFEQNPDLLQFLRAVFYMNLSLLVFNLLPIYPLDGGQIVRSLLWYPFGRAKSLKIATMLGFVGGVGLIGLAIWSQLLWTGFIALFLLSNCWSSYKLAGAMRELEKLPRHPGFKCPVCHAAPPIGNYWICPACKGTFDPFATAAVCPHCQAALDLTTCPDCHSARAQRTWDETIIDA